MNDVLATIIAGIVGTGLMSVLMLAITTSGAANADMVRAIGSIVTKSYDNAIAPGLVIHFVVGIVIAFAYSIFMGLLDVDGILKYITFGLILALFHGLVVSFVLVIMVAQYHPLERFQKAGGEVVIAHFIGHLFYGLGVSVVLGALGAKIVL